MKQLAIVALVFAILTIQIGCGRSEPPSPADQALALLASGHYEEAVQFCDAQIASGAAQDEWLVMRGMVRMSQGQPSLAQPDFEAAIEINPSAYEAYYRLAEIYRNKEEWDKEIHYSDLAKQYDPEYFYRDPSDPGVQESSTSRNDDRPQNAAHDPWDADRKPAIGARAEDHGGTEHELTTAAEPEAVAHERSSSERRKRRPTVLPRAKKRSGRLSDLTNSAAREHLDSTPTRKALAQPSRTESSTAQTLGAPVTSSPTGNDRPGQGYGSKDVSSPATPHYLRPGLGNYRPGSAIAKHNPGTNVPDPRTPHPTVGAPNYPWNSAAGGFSAGPRIAPPQRPYGTPMTGQNPLTLHSSSGATWTPLTSAPTPDVMSFRTPAPSSNPYGPLQKSNTVQGSGTARNSGPVKINTGNYPYPQVGAGPHTGAVHADTPKAGQRRAGP